MVTIILGFYYGICTPNCIALYIYSNAPCTSIYICTFLYNPRCLKCVSRPAARVGEEILEFQLHAGKGTGSPLRSVSGFPSKQVVNFWVHIRVQPTHM